MPTTLSIPLLQNTAQLTPAMLPAVDISALYVHVPFCFHKCHYCDFYSITRQTPERMNAYVERVLAEADQWADTPVGPTVKPRTIFFGGGTPSLLPTEPMRRLLLGLAERFDFSAVDEWTVECNPATVDEAYCAMLRDLGVTRLSFGAQSFISRELTLLERHHEPADVARSVAAARSAGFDRINLDLIFALPGQTLDDWLFSLNSALALGTTHLSCYALTYEPNSALTVRRRLGQFRPAEEDVEMQMLRETRDRLTAVGLPPYEVSNFAAPGQPCRHNLAYWLGDDYIGLGPSAASHVRGVRWKNRSHLGEWELAVDGGGLPTVEAETLTAEQRLGELAMLMLRLETGIDFGRLRTVSGVGISASFDAVIQRYRTVGLLEPTAAGVKLTRAGLPVADAIAGELLTASTYPQLNLL